MALSPDARRMWRKLRRFITIGWRVVLVAIAILVAFVRGVVDFNVGAVDRLATVMPGWMQLSALGVVIASTLRDSLRATVDRIRLPNVLQQQSDWDKIIVGAIDDIIGDYEVDRLARIQAAATSGTSLAPADLAPLTVSRFGANIYVIRHRFKVGPRYLHQVRRWRCTDDPRGSYILWTKGKGAAGVAWRDGAPQHRNLVTMSKQFEFSSITAADWVTLSAVDKDGLTMEEFNSITGNYAEVLVVPMEDADGVLGCVALNLTLDSSSHPGVSILDTPGVKARLRAASGMIADTAPS